MASRTFSEQDLPEHLTLPFVLKHLTHYEHSGQTVLPAAWMLGLEVVVGDLTIDSAEQLQQHPDLELTCTNTLLALIGAPLVAGYELTFTSSRHNSEIVQLRMIDGTTRTAHCFIKNNKFVISI